MNDMPAPAPGGDHAEAALRLELAQGDALRDAAAPMLRHLLANDRSALFSEEIVARVRGMLGDLTDQLSPDGLAARAPEACDALAEALAGDVALLGHLHALALENQLAEKLRERLALDPVLSPLLQALIASDDPATADTAMRFLAAQARFGQSQRRMALPLNELPADLLHSALTTVHAHLSDHGEADAPVDAAHAAIRAAYDEGATRLSLAARLVEGMGGGAIACLTLPHAGLALFASAFAQLSWMGRDAAVLSLQERQGPRAALALRAAGLRPDEVIATMMALDPGMALPEMAMHIASERAAALLARHAGTGGV